MKFCKQSINILLFLHSTLCFHGGAGLLGALLSRRNASPLISLKQQQAALPTGLLGKRQHCSRQSNTTQWLFQKQSRRFLRVRLPCYPYLK